MLVSITGWGTSGKLFVTGIKTLVTNSSQKCLQKRLTATMCLVIQYMIIKKKPLFFTWLLYFHIISLKVNFFTRTHTRVCNNDGILSSIFNSATIFSHCCVKPFTALAFKVLGEKKTKGSQFRVSPLCCMCSCSHTEQTMCSATRMNQPSLARCDSTGQLGTAGLKMVKAVLFFSLLSSCGIHCDLLLLANYYLIWSQASRFILQKKTLWRTDEKTSNTVARCIWKGREKCN